MPKRRVWRRSPAAEPLRRPFMAHWARIMSNETGILNTILADDTVAGNVVYWDAAGEPNIGYGSARHIGGRAFLSLQKTRLFSVLHSAGLAQILLTALFWYWSGRAYHRRADYGLYFALVAAVFASILAVFQVRIPPFTERIFGCRSAAIAVIAKNVVWTTLTSYYRHVDAKTPH